MRDDLTGGVILTRRVVSITKLPSNIICVDTTNEVENIMPYGRMKIDFNRTKVLRYFSL